ncbi:methyltransferase domain-containing protein [Thiotrichales bacterium HSG1]|nr:methyltransferase domain-containing protein [Thiotrichales bacterium HSG1]
MKYSVAVETARSYYNSDDADNFYATIWGGEDIHIGLYESEQDSIFDASRKTVHRLANLVSLNNESKVLDIGSGYGGTARYLAKTTGCKVDCLNLSETQNQRNRQLNQEQNIADRITVIDGSFELIPTENEQYDLVLSQDAILHSGNRKQVFVEVFRVLKPDGNFVFTDPMQSDDCPTGVLQPVLDRIHLSSMGSIGFYSKIAAELGFEKIQIIEMTNQLINHYTHVLKELENNHAEMLKICEQDYLERMKIGLNHWIESGNKGYLAWGILHFRKTIF